MSDFSLTRYLGKQHVVLFFYPKDFTFVCPSDGDIVHLAIDGYLRA